MSVSAAKPFIEILLDKPRKVQFTFNDLADMEKNLGLNVMSNTKFLTEPSAWLLREVLYYSLRTDDPSITKELCGDIIQEHHSKALEALTFAWKCAFDLIVIPSSASAKKNTTQVE